jgi:hypothetical protein
LLLDINRLQEVVDTVRSNFRARKGNNASANPTQPPDLSAKDANTLSSDSAARGTHFPLSTSDQGKAAMDLGEGDLLLLCIIQGERDALPVDVPRRSWRNPKYMVNNLKEKIQKERGHGSLAGVDPHVGELGEARVLAVMTVS